MLKKFLLILTFLFKLRFKKNESIQSIIEKRYGRPAINTYRGLQNSTYKVSKCELDIHFLTTCKAYKIIPKFMRFKLYKTSLYKKKFYKNWQLKLLTEEINSTKVKLNDLKNKQRKWEKLFDEIFTSLIDNVYLKKFINKINQRTIETVKNGL